MVRVSFDALEKVVVSSTEQFRDDRHVASAVSPTYDLNGGFPHFIRKTKYKSTPNDLKCHT